MAEPWKGKRTMDTTFMAMLAETREAETLRAVEAHRRLVAAAGVRADARSGSRGPSGTPRSQWLRSVLRGRRIMPAAPPQTCCA